MAGNRISRTMARRLVLKSHLLDGRTKMPPGKEGAAQTVEALGYVQIDAIAVVERAHHVALWTRRPDYRPEMIYELQAKDRRVFEHVNRALFYHPMADFRYFLPRMRRFEDPYRKWEKDRLKKYGPMMKPALERLRKDGPASSRELAKKLGTRRTSYDMREPTKSALELLHLRGDVMVAERRSFHRIYDLTERVLPAGLDISIPDDAEVGRYCVRRALRTYGLATETEIGRFSHAAERKSIAAALGDLSDEGEVVSVRIEGGSSSDNFALADNLTSSKGLRKPRPAVRLLSPFDSLIIQRDRARRFFDFDYALECFVTPAKRKHGYLVHPILFGEELVGRLDPKADRRKNTLLVQSLLLEDGFRAGEDFLKSLSERLWDFARLNACDRIGIVKTSPVSVRKPLEKHIAAVSPH